jgi:putative phosphoesterase
MKRIVGVISDTHGLLRPEAREALRGVDHIIHAGDIGSPAVLEELKQIAPLTVIRGNNDQEAWAHDIPETTTVKLADHRIYVLHSIADLDLDPEAHQIDVVISGHSHKPLIRESQGVLYLNPGSAGPRRFSLPITVAKLFLSVDTVRAEIITLPVEAPKASRSRRISKR